MVRKKYKNLLIITPGIRLPGDSSNDQIRVMTPKQAFKNKVSGIVIGRSLTKGNIINNTKKLIDHLNKWSTKVVKICGISDPKTLTYIVNHPHPPQFVGFIVNWKASSRYVELERLKELLNIE